MSARRRECLAGAQAQLPLQLGILPFGALYGLGALQAGMPAWLAQAASAIVFAGAAQLVLVQMLTAGAGWGPIFATGSLLNLRHVLYSASVAEYLGSLPRRWRLLLAYLLTDEAFAVGILRYRDPPGEEDVRHWYFLGAGLTMWASWQLSTAIGILFGTALPPEWDLDFAVPLTFIALLTLLLRHQGGRLAAAVAAVAAVMLAALPYKLGLVAAILLALAVAGWRGESSEGEAP